MVTSRCRHDERGVTLIIAALSLTGLLTFSGLVLDGGNAYSVRRQMQNSSDAASLAGARMLDAYHRQDTTGNAVDEGDIYDAALSAALENGGDANDFTCELVDENQTVLGLCPDDTGQIPADAAGVRAEVASTHGTYLMRVAGVDDFTARADATAQIQALRRLNMPATPFMICAFGHDSPAMLESNGASWVINEEALWSASGTPPSGYEDELDGGPWYLIQGPNNEPVAGCETDGSADPAEPRDGFKGWVGDDAPYAIPGSWGANPGDRSGHVDDVLIAEPSACTDLDEQDCLIIAPICTNGDGSGNNATLYCIRFGLFRIVNTSGGNSNNRHHVALIQPDDPIIQEGQGGGLPVDDSELRIIKLVE